MPCYTCQLDKPSLPYVVYSDDNADLLGRECQNCRKKKLRRKRGLRKPGPKRQEDRPTHCSKGHELDEGNTLEAFDASRDRMRYRCKLCFREAAIRRVYGLSPAKYYRMFDAQGGRCAICRTKFGENPRDTHVDHDHETGKVRGLLCPDCNRGLGLFRDDPVAIARALDYLTHE